MNSGFKGKNAVIEVVPAAIPWEDRLGARTTYKAGGPGHGSGDLHPELVLHFGAFVLTTLNKPPSHSQCWNRNCMVLANFADSRCSASIPLFICHPSTRSCNLLCGLDCFNSRTMPADSLLDMARRAMARYANGITDIGDLPYKLVRTALLKIDRPERLVGILARYSEVRQLIWTSTN